MEHQHIPGTTGHDAASTLSVEVPLVSGESESTTMGGELRYTTADPYAVTLVVHTRSGPVPWTFSRELLAEGVFVPSGDGDVQVWPCLSTEATAVVVVELHAPNGDALLQTPSRTVQQFVDDVFRLVPEGAESQHLALDHELEKLLAA